eukprot:1178748-Prorocentrum_minimum.AAC.2
MLSCRWCSGPPSVWTSRSTYFTARVIFVYLYRFGVGVAGVLSAPLPLLAQEDPQLHPVVEARAADAPLPHLRPGAEAVAGSGLCPPAERPRLRACPPGQPHLLAGGNARPFFGALNKTNKRVVGF